MKKRKLNLLKWFIQFEINFRYKYLKPIIYEYKTGDRVKYNWKAKVMILSAIKENVDCVLEILKIEHKNNDSISYINIDTKEIGGCNAYWLIKIR